MDGIFSYCVPNRSINTDISTNNRVNTNYNTNTGTNSVFGLNNNERFNIRQLFGLNDNMRNLVQNLWQCAGNHVPNQVSTLAMATA